MPKHLIELGDDLLDAARAALHTDGIADTVRRALHEAAAAPARARQIEWLRVVAVGGADDVVVEHAGDVDVVLLCDLDEVGRAEQALLLAGDGHEHDRRIEPVGRHPPGTRLAAATATNVRDLNLVSP